MDELFLIDSSIRDKLRSWLTTKTLGGVPKKDSFKYYDKHLWIPIRNTLKSIVDSGDKSIEERELLSCCYSGELFRIHTYNKRLRAHVYPLECYQSWCTEGGLEAFSRRGGQVLLIRGHANPEDYAIKTIELMFYLEPDIFWPVFSGHHELCRYVPEYEVAMPIRKENIDELYVVDSAHLTEWRNYGTPVMREKWFRNNW